jgi:hypothetical protein
MVSAEPHTRAEGRERRRMAAAYCREVLDTVPVIGRVLPVSLFAAS